MRKIAEPTEGILDDDVADRAPDRSGGLPIVRAALEFASARHANQYREIDGAPFIVHPIEVGQLLDHDRQPDEVVAAGLLHDTLEKTTATSTELQQRFGGRVARLVESVSDDSTISDYESRKCELRDRVARAEADTIAIFAADKISKVRELTLLPAPRLDEPTTRARLKHYQATLEMLRTVAGDVAPVDRLEAELHQLLEPASHRSDHDRREPEAPQASTSHRLKPREGFQRAQQHAL